MPKGKTTDVEDTRAEIRHTFKLWDIDPSEFETVWDEPREGNCRLPGATVRYMRAGKWMAVSCRAFATRAQNLRQIFLLLDRLRIAEQSGLQYEGLASSKEITTTANSGESQRKEKLLDAYDFLGVAPDDPIDLVKDVYRKKSMYYHPDKGGTNEKFKRLDDAYRLICQNKGVQP